MSIDNSFLFAEFATRRFSSLEMKFLIDEIEFLSDSEKIKMFRRIISSSVSNIAKLNQSNLQIALFERLISQL